MSLNVPSLIFASSSWNLLFDNLTCFVNLNSYVVMGYVVFVLDHPYYNDLIVFIDDSSSRRISNPMIESCNWPKFQSDFHFVFHLFKKLFIKRIYFGFFRNCQLQSNHYQMKRFIFDQFVSYDKIPNKLYYKICSSEYKNIILVYTLIISCSKFYSLLSHNFYN